MIICMALHHRPNRLLYNPMTASLDNVLHPGIHQALHVSWKVWAFAGVGFMVSVGYMDAW